MTDTERSGRFGARPMAAAAAAAVVLAAILAYLPGLHAPFAFFDDELYVERNTVLQQIALTEVWRIFTTRTNAWDYLPVRDLTYRIDLALFGLNPAGFRAHNLLLYAICCAGVWRLTGEMLHLLRGRSEPRDAWIAATATALFAVHPAHVESVAWVAGRKDVLSGALAIWSLAIFARALRRAPDTGHGFLWSYLLFACAILSKSTVVPLPAVAWLLALAHECRQEGRVSGVRVRRATLRVVPLLILALGSVLMQVWGSTVYDGGQLVGEGAQGLIGRAWLALRIFGTLAGIAVAPWRPRLIYDVEAPGIYALAATAAGVIAAALTIVAAVLVVRRRSPAWFGVAMAGILMTPFLQLIPFSTWSYASDRFVFLPSAGAALAAAAALHRLGAAPRRLMLALLLIGALFGTSVHAWKWRAPAALVKESAALAPGNAMAVMTAVQSVLVAEKGYARAREAAGRMRSQRHQAYLYNWIDALEASDRKDTAALRAIVPRLYETEPRDDIAERVRTAELAIEAGLPDLAETAYRGLLRDFPAFATAHYDLGLVLVKQGRQAEALDAMQRAIDAGVRKADVWNNLGLLARNLGQSTRAADAFRRALAADPKHWHAGYNLGRLLWARGDADGARLAMADARRRAVAAGASPAPVDEVIRIMESTPPPAPR